ncbi:MAG: type 4a pilus biogenesis protein PilO [Clostridiales bacterium]|jgi:Tfp pilus assembly protein PilO|nr:type 4a pilus biogenesis protein PilO [Clostridiales bacterium]
MKLTKREKRFVILLVVVSVLSVYYVYFYQPLQEQIQNMITEIKMGEDALKLKESKEDEVKILKEELQALTEETTNLLDSLPHHDYPSLLVHLNEITAPRVNREYIEIGDVEVQTEFVILPVFISVSAEYNNFKEMLKMLEESPYRNRVESLSVHTVDDGVNINADIALKFFFKPESDEQDNSYPFMNGRFGKDNPFRQPVSQQTEAED